MEHASYVFAINLQSMAHIAAIDGNNFSLSIVPI